MTKFHAALDALQQDLLREPEDVSLLDLGDRFTAIMFHEDGEVFDLPDEDPPEVLASILGEHVYRVKARSGEDLGGACRFEMSARRLGESTWFFTGVAMEADVYSSIVYFEAKQVGISCLYYGDIRSSFHFHTHLIASADPLTIN